MSFLLGLTRTPVAVLTSAIRTCLSTLEGKTRVTIPFLYTLRGRLSSKINTMPFSFKGVSSLCHFLYESRSVSTRATTCARINQQSAAQLATVSLYIILSRHIFLLLFGRRMFPIRSDSASRLLRLSSHTKHE